MSKPLSCVVCDCPCHCNYAEHSTWGGPPSEFSGKCSCETCIHEQ